MSFRCGDIVETTYLGGGALYRLVSDVYSYGVADVVTVWSTNDSRPVGYKLTAIANAIREPTNQLLAIALFMEDPPPPFVRRGP